jgi:hypothetical protein
VATARRFDRRNLSTGDSTQCIALIINNPSIQLHFYFRSSYSIAHSFEHSLNQLSYLNFPTNLYFIHCFIADRHENVPEIKVLSWEWSISPDEPILWALRPLEKLLTLW